MSSYASVRLWDARTGQPLLECKGHAGPVTAVSFSPDGQRLATASRDKTARVWELRTGQPLLVCQGNTDTVASVAFSPDGLCLATASADGTARVWDARPKPLPGHEEVELRGWATRPEPSWHEQCFYQHQTNDRFAAAFHLDRLLACRPEQRAALLRQRTAFCEAELKRNDGDTASWSRLLLARTAWHSPALGPRNAAALLPAADEASLLGKRTYGGLLLRLKKADEALPLLEAALKERGEGKPPVEELLLAWGYLDTNQPVKARELWKKATAWLDHQEVVWAASIPGTFPAGAVLGAASLLAPPANPRNCPFEWETWHELDVLRRELAPRFVAAP